jgi:hypothetical protein
MRALSGPFVPDTNVSGALLFFEDTLIVINRRLLQGDPAEPGFGMLQFTDVRAHRVRNEGLNLERPPSAWALELSESDYLRDVVQCDEQRTAEALSRHKHYLVVDGNHRTVDVVARDVTISVIAGPLISELERLAAGFAEDFM